MWEKEAELLGAIGLRYTVSEFDLEDVELIEMPDPAAAFEELQEGRPSLNDELRAAFAFING
jgi:hypothetical protein